MSGPSWLEPDEYPVLRAFSRSARLFVQLDRELHQDVGIRRTYFEILWLLRQALDHALRMSQVAEVTGSQPSLIAHVVARLERAGQVQRERRGPTRLVRGPHR